MKKNLLFIMVANGLSVKNSLSFRLCLAGNANSDLAYTPFFKGQTKGYMVLPPVT